MAALRRNWLRLLVHVGAWLPLASLGWRTLTDTLGTNPIETITHVTGKAALVLLVLSLACTPVNTVFGFSGALRVRRALGLYAFGYAALHFLTFIGLDYGFDLDLIQRDAIAEKPYIIVGALALVILVALAATSTRGWMRRLGRTWTRLHRWVYAAGVLVVVHYIWVVKALSFEPVFFAVVVGLLLALRLPAVRRAVSRARQSRSTASAATPSEPS